MNSENDRFAGTIGREYEEFLPACPHYNKCEDWVEEAVREWAQAHHDLPQITIVEIGCGTGLTTQRLLAADARVRVIAIDLSETMIRQAEATFADESARIQFVLADALEALRQLSDASVDVVASAFMLHNLQPEQRLAIFKEIGRVVRSGGLVVNSDKIAQDNPTEHEAALALQLERLQVLEPDLREQWVVHYREDDLVRLTESEQLELFRRAGCDPLNIRQLGRDVMEAAFRAIKK